MRDWLTHRATATPDAEALVAADTGTTWTYDELDEAADELASRLTGVGIEAGDNVVAYLPPRPEYVTLVHAAMRVGVRLVPISDRLTAHELRPRLERADATLVVVGDATEQRAVEATAENDPDAPAVPVVSVDEPGWERIKRLQTIDPGPVEPYRWADDDPLCFLFTSGSTGEPKLVTITAGNVLASVVALAFRLGVDPDDRTLATLAFHHTGGLMPLYRETLAGTTLVLRREFDAGGAADDVRRHDITKVSLVPTMLKRMLDARGTLADSLRVVLLGGAPAPESLIGRCRDYSVPVYPTYGMTEAASGITVATPDEAFDRSGTVGRPLLGTELSVRDADGERVAPGEVGELVVEGPSITPGYYGDPDATAAVAGDHGLHTGDIGYRDEDGYVYVLNRKDDRIVTGGENVDPGEVVGVLRRHPHVADAAVVGVPDEEWGERVAALVVRADESLGAEDLGAFCRDRLAGFKIPRVIRFADALPRTDSGSVERPAVRDRLAAVVDGIDDADVAAREDAADAADTDTDVAGDTDDENDDDNPNDASHDTRTDESAEADEATGRDE